MSGWDDYVTQPPTAQRPTALALPIHGFEDGAVYHQGTPDESDSPIFTLGQVQFTLPSALFALSCTSNILVLACTGHQLRSSSSSSSSLPPTPPQLIRIDLDNPTQVESFDLPFSSLAPTPSSRGAAPAPAQPAQFHAVHVDPTGRHALVSTTNGDNFYLFIGALPSSLPSSTPAQQAAAAQAVRKPKALQRLKGAVINAVGWPSSSPSSSSSSAVSPYSTRPILLGTTTGQLLETTLHDPALAHLEQQSSSSSAFSLNVNVPGRSQGAEKYVKQLFTLPAREAVVGVRYESWGGQGGQGAGGKKGAKKSVAVVAATKTRMYQFVGTTAAGSEGGEEGSLLEEALEPYTTDEARPKLLELPGEPPSSELHFFAPPRSDGKGLTLPKTLAWLTEPGIYRGHLLFPPSSDALPPGEGIIDSASLIPYPSLSPRDSEDPQEQPELPISMALTEFHFVLLYSSRIVAVDLLTDRVVYDEALALPPNSPPLKLSTDPLRRTIWLYSDSAIYELVVREEERDVWKVYLKRGEWELARKWAKSPQHRSLVLAAEANSFFTAGRYIQAAQSYAQTDAQSFEEVVLRFVEKGERDALRYYLVARLERLKKTDLTQRTLLATWLVELYLAKLNELDDLAAAASGRAGAGAGGGGEKDDEAENLGIERGIVEDDMRTFLQTYKEHLDSKTTFDLLVHHGHDDLMLYFAGLVGDHARIVQHHVAAQHWTKALQALSKQEDLELYYRYASVLLRQSPKETVDVFLRQPRLSVRRLIPALTAPRPPPSLASASTSTAPPPSTEHLIRYLLNAVFEQHNTDPAVHNTLVTLFATSSSPSSSSTTPSTQIDEGAFIRFLETAPTNPNTHDPYYDLDYALRLCRAHKRTQACVVIYSKMGLYDESVELALEQDDLELAKVCADKPEEDDLLRKKLWLKVAKHVVGKKNDIKTAMRFLESTPLLKIEDILPFFPDFVVIDDFKDEICDALEGYAAHIERLKGDMGDATRAADAIKADIAELDERFVVVNANEKCGSCGTQLLTRQFYVFPCQHSFHADCLIQEVTKTLSPTQLRRMLSLQAQLAPSSTTSTRQRHARLDETTALALSSAAATSTAGLKLAAQASVQAVDQLRKLVLPDALLSAIGGAIPVSGALPGMGMGMGMGNGSRNRAGVNGRVWSGYGADGGGGGGAGAQDATTLAQSASARREAKEKLQLREQLDELLARECVLCEGAINGIDRGFVEEGEEM